MQVFLSNEVDGFELNSEYEENIIKTAYIFAEFHQLDVNIQVSISLVDDEQIQAINKEYRCIDKVTDVISFALDDGEEFEIIGGPEEKLLGEIMICVPQTIRQAKEYGHSIERELCYLTVHGLLHLLGYDHMHEEEKVAMRQEEEKIMQLLGLQRV